MKDLPYNLIIWPLVFLLAFSSFFTAHAQAERRYFPETGHFISGEFLAEYLSVSNPLTLYGYPLTEQFFTPEGLLVQYFQRARFEYHADLPADRRVTHTDLGRALYTPGSQINVTNAQDCEYFPVTGHSVCFDFLHFFQQNGGINQFGLPISPFEYHDSLIVQYFEKARFEWRPALPAGQQITLTDLGRWFFDRASEDPARLAPLSVSIATTPDTLLQPSTQFTPTDTSPQFFPQTGHYLDGDFLQYYLSIQEAVSLFGFPITEAYTNSSGRLVQYFDRVRFELHPESESRVVVTDVGTLTYSPSGQLTVFNSQDCQFFDTGYWVCYDFLNFYVRNGGQPQFGAPISPFEFRDGILMQTFEKARFEWHPLSPDKVILSDLGLQYFKQVGEEEALLASMPAYMEATPVILIATELNSEPLALAPLGDVPLPPDPELLVPPTLIVPAETVTPEPTLMIPPPETVTIESLPPEPQETMDIELTSTFLPSEAVQEQTPSLVLESNLPSETPSSTYTPSLTPTLTFTPTETPSPTSTSSVTPAPVPTYTTLRGTVLVRSNCRYGPGQPYLYKYGLVKGNRMEIFGRNDAGTWVYVRAIRGRNPCWVNASLLEIDGDVMSVEPVYPNKAPLPKSPYYSPLTGVKASRNGDQVRITWTGVKLRAGDEESETSPLYVAEVWICRGGAIVFTPIGLYDNVAYVTDEAGCGSPSHGRVFLAEKHGYAGPTEIPWPSH